MGVTTTNETNQGRRFRVLGTTDCGNGCECCGRQNLKVYVGLEDLATGETFLYGTGCAAKAERIPASTIAHEAKDADRLRRHTIPGLVRQAVGVAREAIFRRWAEAQGATFDRFGNCTPPTGVTVWELRKAHQAG